MKKIISGITALCIASGSIIGSSFNNNFTHVSAQQYTYKAADLVAAISNLTRDVPLSEEQIVKLDINKDSKINVVDIIYLKAILLEDMDAPEQNTTTTQLNQYATQIFDAVQKVTYLYEASGEPLEDKIYSSDDTDDFVVDIKQSVCLPENIKWSVNIKDYIITGVICTDTDKQRTGAYPNAIPQSMSIPYSTDYLSYSADTSFKWKEKLSGFISKDEAQASLPDYPDMTTTQLNEYAEMLFGYTSSTLTSLDTQGISLPEGPLTSYTAEYSDTEKKVISDVYYIPGLRWSISFKGNVVNAIICTDLSGKHTGAYPNTIPQNMNISYNENMLGSASDLNFNWKKEFSDCISSDPVQAALPDYPDLPVQKLNLLAKSIFNFSSSVLVAMDTKGTPAENKLYTYDDGSVFSSEINSSESYLYRLKWSLIIKDNQVQGVICSDNTGNHSGAYPNTISQKMNIPYNTEFTKYSFDKTFDWKTELSKYISSDPKQASLPDTPAMTAAQLNTYAKNILCDIQTIVTSYETKGLSLENKTYSSDDSDQLIQNVKSEYSYPEGIKFDFVIKDYIVKGIICTDSNGESTGAYPNTVPQNLAIPYNRENLSYSYKDNSDWKSKFSGYISPDPKQAILSDYPRLFTYQLEEQAKDIYNSASIILTMFKTQGTVIEDKTYSSDDKDKFVDAVKDIYIINPSNYKWSVTIKNGYVTEAVCYGTNSHRIGRFPVKK